MKRAWFELLGALMNEDVDMTVNVGLFSHIQQIYQCMMC